MAVVGMGVKLPVNFAQFAELITDYSVGKGATNNCF